MHNEDASEVQPHGSPVENTATNPFPIPVSEHDLAAINRAIDEMTVAKEPNDPVLGVQQPTLAESQEGGDHMSTDKEDFQDARKNVAAASDQE